MRYSGAETTSLVKAAVGAAGKLGDAVLQGEALFHLGILASDRFDPDTARAYLEEARQHFEQAGKLLGQANCVLALGDVALRHSDNDTARARYEQARPLFQQVGDVVGEANCVLGLGDIALARSDRDAARARFEEALALYRRIHAVHSIGLAHRRLARIAGTEGERDQHLDAARTAWASIGRADLVEELEDEFGEG